MQKTDLNVSPYFDDYNQNKRFSKILFQPRTVQARELNQMQSILQQQIERFGNNIFNEGSPVIEGGMNVIEHQNSISFTLLGTASLNSIKTEMNAHQVYISGPNGIHAKLIKIADADSALPPFFFVDYDSQATDGSAVFAVGAGINIYVFNDDGSQRTLADATVDSIGIGAWARILSGVYYIRGNFILCETQDVVISKNSQTANIRVGFDINEKIITEIEDTSLYSNALGTPNFKAPGAHRLRFDLNVVARALALPLSDNFVELLRIENGVLQRKVSQSDYNIIADTMALRTYEESGDYTVDAFQIDIKEHLKVESGDGTNLLPRDGVYTTAQGGDDNKFVVKVKPGIGYVRGYRIQNIGTQYVNVDKARDVQHVNNTAIGVDYGQYVAVNSIVSPLPIDFGVRTNLKGGTGNNTIVGTCIVRNMRKTTAGANINVFDVRMNAGYTFADVKAIEYQNGGATATATLTTSSLFDSARNSAIFPLPYLSAKSLKSGGNSDTIFTVSKTFVVNLDSDGKATITLSSAELFSSVNNEDYQLGTLDGGVQTGIVPTSAITLGGVPHGRSATITSAANQGRQVVLVAPVIKTSPAEKTKTLTQNQVTLQFNGVSSMTLPHGDIQRIESIVDGDDPTINLKAMFTHDSGQRDAWIEVGSLNSTSGAITRKITVNYWYFAHGAGIYASVDSYGALPREIIPSYKVGGTTYSLADVLDFRPLMRADGTFATQTETIRNQTTAFMDLDYHQPRIDALYVDSHGAFGIARGIPSDSPVAPAVPENSMRLYNLRIPAYTSDVLKIGREFIENKRYTMRDIGKLEKRIENVEYYTSLSLLETKVNNINMLDPVTGTNRFKNGFAVDDFTDLRLGDIMNKDWNASFDLEKGRLMSAFTQSALPFTSDGETSVSRGSATYLMNYNEVVETKQPQATKTINVNPYAVYTWQGSIELTPATDFWKDIYYTPPTIVNETKDLTNGAVAGVVQQTVRFEYGASRINTTTTTISESKTTNSTDSFIKTEVIPFMRSIPIKIDGVMFKPYTRMYPFFDGVDVSAYCRMSDAGTFGEPLKTDVRGNITFYFQVPNTDERKFPTGISTMMLTESPIGAAGVEFSSGDGVFSSGGSLETRQVTIVNTRTLISSVTDSTRTVSFQPTRRVKDPIAQSFFINSKGGCYLTSVDVFLSTKAKDLPITLQLRTVENGYPTGDVMPFGEVNLAPSQVNVSADASVATNFRFSDPIFVNEGQQYAIVLLADTQEYNAYIAEMGEGLVDQSGAVSKQPHIGVFFTSANGSTWSANQLQDMKFTVNRADVDITSNSSITFSCDAPTAIPLGINPVSTIVGSKTITVTHPSNGLAVGDMVTLSGIDLGNGLETADMTGVFRVTATTDDTYSVEVNGTNSANATGRIGGSMVKSTANTRLTSWYANVTQMKLPNTDLQWSYRYRLKSNRAFTDWITFEPNLGTKLDDEGVIAQRGDFQIRVLLTSRRPNLSPCIDMDAMMLAVVFNRIGDVGSDIKYSYITKPIVYDTPCKTVRTYLGALIPPGNSMKVEFQITGTDVWNPIEASSPIVYDGINFMEYQFQFEAAANSLISGYRFRVSFNGSNPCTIPELSDFRSIGFA